VAAFDAYSLGVVMGELLAHAMPDLLGGCPSAAAVAACLAGAAKNCRVAGPCRRFLVALLHRNPAERLTMQAALQHPYLADVVANPTSSLGHPSGGNLCNLPSIAALQRDEATAKDPATYFKQLFVAHYHGGDVTFAPADSNGLCI
jgi:serine/threonine protein kinase